MLRWWCAYKRHHAAPRFQLPPPSACTYLTYLPCRNIWVRYVCLWYNFCLLCAGCSNQQGWVDDTWLAACSSCRVMVVSGWNGEVGLQLNNSHASYREKLFWLLLLNLRSVNREAVFEYALELLQSMWEDISARFSWWRVAAASQSCWRSLQGCQEEVLDMWTALGHWLKTYSTENSDITKSTNDEIEKQLLEQVRKFTLI